MKKNIHPKYNTNVTVTCSCGNTFVTGSTEEAIFTELCYKCHPFYTGEQRIVDSDNLVQKFEERKKKASSSFRNKRQKMAARKEKLAKVKTRSQNTGSEQGLTLKDILANMK